jgi:hypothetical protein
MPDPAAILSLHLWDLRAQVEAQLRCLTTTQRVLKDYEATTLEQDRQAKRSHVSANIADMQRMNGTIAYLLGEAAKEVEEPPSTPPAGR